MQVEHEIRAYMDWFQKEVDECNRALSGRVSYWGEFQPPYKIVVEIEPDGYKSGLLHYNFNGFMDYSVNILR